MKSATAVRALLLAVSLALSLLGRAASAQELEPRSYVNTPIGINFLIAGYAYQTGDVATDASLRIENAKIRREIKPVNLRMIAVIVDGCGG